jgi:hypothetical protein
MAEIADLFASTAPALPFDIPNTEGFAASWNEPWNGFDVTVPGGSFFYAEHFFSKAWSDRTIAYLQENAASIGAPSHRRPLRNWASRTSVGSRTVSSSMASSSLCRA